MKKTDIAVVMTDLLNHAENGERDPAIPDEAYEFRTLAVRGLRDALLGGVDPDKAIEIVVGKLEGVYDGKD